LDRKAVGAIFLAAMLSACVAPTATNPSSGSRLNSPASAPRTSSPSPTSPGIAECPTTIRNVSGAYRFQCPAGWKYVNCESSATIGAFTWLINPGGCSPEPYGARMMVWGVPGEVSAESGASGMYVGTRKSSKNLVIDGISGTRRTYLVTKSLPLPPPKGTTQVVYTFVTGGETHFAQYNRYPKEPDLTAAFDLMITKTLRFSA
jgi:hypothetical protein